MMAMFMAQLSKDSRCLKSGSFNSDTPNKWGAAAYYKLFVYISLCYVLVINVPNIMWDPVLLQVTIVVGTIGIWRYSWWFIHMVRAEIYARIRYPKIRYQADKVWHEGWRPPHIHFLMTTFLERRDTTELVLNSILREIRETKLPATIWLGSGDSYDEDIMMQYLRQYGRDLPVELIFIRQNVSGKRMAIGLVLRAMSRRGIGRDDMVCFMDGDAIFAPGIVQKCTSVFATDPELQAITTNEEVLCFGPKWVGIWLTMRFAQRRVAMQSHSMSNKVLTLTGRMSVFRANHLTRYEFIRKLEADHLNHWLWGEFRFLSGDDKSTWYYMLTKGAKMLYLPDAMVYTVDEVEGSGLVRMTENFHRWSGNMLRNGSRALALGPRKAGFFIWWCVLDQRVAMWTMLVSPVVAITASLVVEPAYIVTYFVWILCSRMALSLFLFRYTDQVYISFPIILYVNQLLNAVVKVHCFFRLSQQRWSNRGNQCAGMGHSLDDKIRNHIASWVTAVWVGGLVMFVCLYCEILHVPSYQSLMALLIT